MDKTPNLVLPYIVAAQAQKHVTHNEAIRALDALVQLSVLDRDLSAPPASPVDGDRYVVGASATGAWAGKEAQIAAYQDNAWMFYAPGEGWLCWIADEDKLFAWDGTAWSEILTSVNPIALVGVNATADTANRLAVASPAVLFDNEGSDSRVKVNKNASADSATFLYQSGYSGRAETGLAGDDDYHFKVSPDGSAWKEALVIDKSTGEADFKQGVSLTKNQDGATKLTVSNTDNSASAEAQVKILGPASSLVQWRLPYNSASPYFQFFSSNVPGGYYQDFATHTFRAQGGVSTYATLGSSGLRVNNPVTPSVDNSYTCGSSSLRWSSVWAANGTIQTSDERDKHVVGSLKKIANELVDAIEPIMFRWKVGGNEVTSEPAGKQQPINRQETDAPAGGSAVPLYRHEKPGVRIHAGWRAQDFQAVLERHALDFGGWGLEDKDDPDSRQWLRPDQIIPVLWECLRQTREQVKELRTRIDNLS